jgi:hypothetical protein
MRITLPPAPLAVPALVALLAGCGGGAAEQAGTDFADAFICGAIRNCTDSSTLQTDELSPRFGAEQPEGSGMVKVDAYMGKSANVFTAVRLAPAEQLRASVDGGAETAMANPNGNRIDHEATLPAASARPRVTVVFVRDGQRHVSEVTLPPAFAVVQPVGTPTLARTAGSLLVRLGPDDAGGGASASASGSCSRTDGSSFEVKGLGLAVRAESGTASSYRIGTVDLDQALNTSSQAANANNPLTPLVARCQLRLTWSTTSAGSTAATLNRHGIFNAYRRASHAIGYDAGL